MQAIIRLLEDDEIFGGAVEEARAKARAKARQRKKQIPGGNDRKKGEGEGKGSGKGDYGRCGGYKGGTLEEQSK